MRLKFIYLLWGWFFLISSVKSQPLVYQFSAFQGGNPGGLNTDIDTLERSSANGFIQLLGPGSNLPSFSPALPLPFPFQFYGQTQNQFCISHTGVLTFDISRAGNPTAPSPTVFSTNSLPANSIAACWGAFPFPAGTGSQSAVFGKVYGQSPNRQYWIDWTRFNLNNGTGIWFSLVLEETTNAIYVIDRGVFSTAPQPFRSGLKLNISTFDEVPGGFLSLQPGTTAVSDNRGVRFMPLQLQSETLEIFQNSTTSFGSLPDPYSTFSQGSRQQFLIRKNELQDLNAYPILKSLSFNRVTSLSTPVYSNYTIKLKNVTEHQLSQGFISGAQQVFFTGSYQSLNGWNNHVFQTPFEWDTSKNLLVEICFTGNTGQPFNSQGVTGGFFIPQTSLAIVQNSSQVCNSPFFTSQFVQVNSAFRPDFRLLGVEPYLDLLPPNLDSLSNTTDNCTPTARTIRVRVRDNRGAMRVNLLHRAFNSFIWDSIPMVNVGGNFWEAVLPPVTAGIPWRYTAAAIDSVGNRSDTLAAKSFTDGTTVFSLGPDITAIQGTLKTLSPNRDGVKGLKITEVILSSGPAYSSQLQGTFPTNAPSVFSADEVVEVQNVSNDTFDVSGFQLEWLLSNPAVPRLNFTFPSGTILGPNQLLLVYSGSLPNQPTDRIFYMGSFANLMSSTERAGFILKDTGSAILDAVAVNGFNFLPTTGVTLDDWNGQIFVPNNSTGIRRENETNQASDWKVITTGRDTTSFGFTNPQMLRDLATYFWRKGQSNTVISQLRELPIVVQNPEQYHLELVLGTCSFRDTININTLTYCAPQTPVGSPFIREWRLGSKLQVRQSANDIPPLNLNSGLTLVAGKGPYRFRAISQNTTQPYYLSAWLDLNRDGQITDSTEKIFQSRFNSDTAYARFTVPGGSNSGPLLMRIAMHADSLTTACGPFQAYHEDVVAQYIQPAEDLNPPVLTITKTTDQVCAPSLLEVSTTIQDDEGADSVRFAWNLWPDAIAGIIPAQWDSASWIWKATLPAPTIKKILSFRAIATDFNQNNGSSKEDAVSNQVDAVYAGIDTVSRVGGPLTRRAGFTRNGLIISEILLIPALQGARANADSTTGLYWGPDMVEITNVSDTIQDVGGYRLKVEVIQMAVPNYYEARIPAGTLIPPGGTIVFTAGTYIFQLPPRLIPFNFANTRPDIWDYDDRIAMALFNPAGFAVDAVFLNDHEPLNPQDWPGATMYGRLIPELVSGIQRTRAEDLDLASDWESTTANSGRVINMGKLNSILNTQHFRCGWTDSASLSTVSGSVLTTTFSGKKTWIFSATYNQCTITDTFIAEADSLFKDLFVNRFVQNTNTLFYDSVSVGIWISNKGITPIDTFVLNLFDNNQLYVSDTIRNSLAIGDSLQYFFSLPWAAAQPGFRGLRASGFTKGDRNSTNDSIYLLVNSQVSVKDLETEEWACFPNPAKSHVYLKLPKTEEGNWSLTLVDAAGRRMLQHHIQAASISSAPFALKLDGIQPGIYFIQASHPEKGQRHWRVFKE